MATETPPEDGGRRKRSAPTIDLKATEVSAEPQETAAPAEPESPPPAEAAAPTPEKPSAPETREPFIPPPPERPHQHAEQAEPEPDRRSTMPPPGFARASFWPMIGAGAAGAGGVLAAFILLWAIGAVPSGQKETVDLSPRLAAIETQLRDLTTRPPPVVSVAPASADTKVVEGLSLRLDKLEAAANAPRQPVTDPAVLNRIGAVDSAVKTLNDNVNALARRNDEAATTMRGRLDALSASVVEIQKKEQEAASDRPVRLAVASGALRVAVERGQPFAAELAAAKSLTQDTAALAPLEPFAASGVPNDAVLGRELSALIQPMLKATAPQASEASFLDRLQANAEKLVRIRPIGAPTGDDPAAMLARIEFKAAHGDIAGALADLAKLPADARAKAQAWIAKVEARDKAIAASRRFNADAIAALKTTP
ncbi:MAG: hypothetical protein AB1490_26825 [Pseudomonadota bacterium]